MLRQTSTVIGARDFAVSAAAIWNSLPAALRLSSGSVQTFAWKLEAFFASEDQLFFALRMQLLIMLLLLLLLL